MNDTNYKSIDFGALTRAGEGLTQWRALGMGFLTLLSCMLLFWLVQLATMRIGGLVGGILAFVLLLAVFVVWVAGYSGVGVLLMDKARELPQRSIGEAATFGLGTVPKFLLLGLAVFVAMLAFSLVAALLYFVCKIPFLGAILAFIVHPVLVLIAAVAFIACVWVVFPLFAPAVWSGLSFKQALSSVFAIARNRLVPVVLMMMVLYIILMVITVLIMSGLFPAMTSLTGLASSVMGGGAANYGAYNGAGGMGGLSSALGALNSSSMVGAMLGMSVLGALVFALVMLVAMMGMNLLYLQASSGLDTAGTESDIEGAFGAMKEKAREAADKAKAAAERAKAAAAERVQAASDAREAAALETAKREEEEAQARAEIDARQAQERAQTEREAAARQAAEREAAAKAAAEREAQEAQARAEAQRQAAARAEAATQPPASETPTSPSVGATSAAIVGGIAAAAGAAASAGADIVSGKKECKACQHLIGVNDLFCENCGTKQ